MIHLLALLVQFAPAPAWCWSPSSPAWLRAVTWEAGDGARCVGRRPAWGQP